MGDPRHLRGYVEAGGKLQLLDRNSLPTDVVLALVKITRHRGSAYDLTVGHEAKVARVIEEDGDLQSAYDMIREHLTVVIEIRVKGDDPHAERLHRLCSDIPDDLLSVQDDHEACFAEFDAWHQVATLRDLARIRCRQAARNDLEEGRTR